ncbi:hypothetical protein KKG83_02425 [Candidatus Micrarchaeota archaeon]|nr:hypothetical protein [Candidatus Micrarchaeota archaeon]MBU2476306.1 hypothetical protein [Candidatus Micrarchaeota archaeon]
MKKLSLLFLVMLAVAVNAVQINSATEIPANINWSFSVELNPSNSFTKTEVYFDELFIVTAFNDKQPIIQEDFVLKTFVFDKVPEDNTGLTLYVSYFGIEEGTHKIKTKTFNGESLIEEKEFELNAVDTITALQKIPESIPREEVDLLMNTMIDKINKDKEELDALKNSTEQNLEDKTAVLEQEIKSLEDSLSELSSLKELAAKEEKKAQEKLLEIKKTVFSGETQTTETIDSGNSQKENFATGFYNFSVSHAWYGVVFLIVLLVLIALFQLYKIKGNSDMIFEEALEDKAKEEKRNEKIDFALQEEDSAEMIPKKTKKFGLSDLLKK